MRLMKKALWILFVVAAILWTALAWVAAGIAQWTADSIASGRAPEFSQQITQSTETTTRSVAETLGQASRAASDQVAAAKQSASDAVTGAVKETVEATKSLAAATAGAVDSRIAAIPSMPPIPALPPLPALPEWVNQWLSPESVQALKAWGEWAKAAAGAGLAHSAAPSKPIANQAAAPTAALPTDPAAKVAAAVAEPVAKLTAEAKAGAAAAAPWLANLLNWLVPVVWFIWGAGLLLGVLLTLLAQAIHGRVLRSN
jgi:hypothetical protein